MLAPLIIRARAFLDLRASDEALTTLRQLLTTMPDDEEGATMALQLFMDQKRHREARAV